MSQKEAKARLKINKILEEADWRFFDKGNKYANIQVEPNVKMTRKQVDELGEDFEKLKEVSTKLEFTNEGWFPFIILIGKGLTELIACYNATDIWKKIRELLFF